LLEQKKYGRLLLPLGLLSFLTMYVVYLNFESMGLQINKVAERPTESHEELQVDQ